MDCDLLLVPALPEELASVIAILDQAARWMLDRGIRQWDSPSPPEVRQRMAREIENHEVYLAYLPEAAEPVGTLRFEWTGRLLWPAEADAGYIHTMAVQPAWTA